MKRPHLLVPPRMIRFRSLCMVLLALLMMPEISYAQRSRKKKEPTIFVSSMIHYFSTNETFQFSRSFGSNNRDLVLTYLTANSGTFVVESDLGLVIETVQNYRIPLPLLTIGASLQIVKESRVFHLFLQKRAIWESYLSGCCEGLQYTSGTYTHDIYQIVRQNITGL